MDGIRIGVQKGGCNGLEYTISYATDKNREKDDVIIIQHGVNVVVDNRALFYILGTTIDFKEDDLRSGFVFDNPNVKSTCGCEQSFSAFSFGTISDTFLIHSVFCFVLFSVFALFCFFFLFNKFFLVQSQENTKLLLLQVPKCKKKKTKKNMHIHIYSKRDKSNSYSKPFQKKMHEQKKKNLMYGRLNNKFKRKCLQLCDQNKKKKEINFFAIIIPF
ncbi:hypothetical protein RFI_10525 [Reticulomyxa filosa]|uniref:Core domain-containing protein n=1 Tax=Reticulomyxa filosa TaxID=46433 RepID=X6NKT7_RETFI|nr:hypothetical protein RFI_10525 [Reticulomyxa filosa]|eukprot:ETO26611.1 hypothetical protein RFI_10525 [Reticulomyxa filosa]